MSNLSLAKTLQDACTAMIEREFACLIIPGLREAIRADHDRKQAIMALEKFIQFVRELAEPPMAKRLDWSRWRIGDMLLAEKINNVQYVISQNLPCTLKQMGFEFNDSRYFHPLYDFAVCFECATERWSIDATKTSLRHFFRKFFKHIENETYERAEMEYRRDEF